MEATAAAGLTRRWLEQFVVAENLCPFAAPLLGGSRLRIAICADTDDVALATALLDEFDLLQRTAPAELETTLLVFSAGLVDFDHYLDFVALAEEMLHECDLDGVLQIASFHPQYRFAGVEAGDVSHFSNRSPLPMVHLLREASVSRALANYPQPELIPQRNIDHLRALGLPAVKALLARIDGDR